MPCVKYGAPKMTPGEYRDAPRVFDAADHFASPALDTPVRKASRPAASVTPALHASLASPAPWLHDFLGAVMPAVYSVPATATRSFHFVTVRDTPLVDGIFFHVSVLLATQL